MFHLSVALKATVSVFVGGLTQAPVALIATLVTAVKALKCDAESSVNVGATRLVTFIGYMI